MKRNFEAEARKLLTEDEDEAHTVCRWCGLMYIARPYLCLCRSNVFLQARTENDTVEEKR